MQKHPLSFLKLGFITLIYGCSLQTQAQALHQNTPPDPIQTVITNAFKPLMNQYHVPGMAIGIIYKNHINQQYYGVQSIATATPVTPQTIFELGSVSKIFTATAGAYAKQQGKISFQDHPSQYWPALKQAPIDQLNLLQLLTYTSGHLSLQFPETVKTDQQVLSYFKNWQIKNKPGQYRQYSNPSIGLFGHLTAKAVGMPFTTWLEGTIFPQLELKNTYIQVPSYKMKDYALGYDSKNRPIRVDAGPFSAEAYGVKSTLPDLLQFLKLSLHPETSSLLMKQAILDTQQGYYKVVGHDMYQALGWEMFAYPTRLETLTDSNTEQIIFESNEMTTHFSEPRSKVFHKTGSTNGFGTYLFFVPNEDFALVMLMNKRIPNQERIKAAYRVFTELKNHPALK